MPFFVPIVEGHGEVQAVPALLRRLASAGGSRSSMIVNPPIRVKSGSFLNDDAYFRKYIELAAAKACQAQGHVMILLDCEDECPADLGPSLMRRAREVRSDVSFLIVLAFREYETWFVTAARSLRGRFGFPMDLKSPVNPEGIRDAKGWLSQRMTRPYDPICHQLDFTCAIDIDQARKNASFRRMMDSISSLEAG